MKAFVRQIPNWTAKLAVWVCVLTLGACCFIATKERRGGPLDYVDIARVEQRNELPIDALKRSGLSFQCAYGVRRGTISVERDEAEQAKEILLSDCIEYKYWLELRDKNGRWIEHNRLDKAAEKR